MREQIATIKHIIELTLGQKLSEHNFGDCLFIDVAKTKDLDLIQYYISNLTLVTKQLIDDLVAEHLAMFKHHQENSAPATRWDQYLLKLETALAHVKYKRMHNFSWEQIMPTQHELLQWQQECLDLTQNWYGPDRGNISCFYNYYIAMTQIAGVTRFDYLQIAKFVSEDQYVSGINKDQRRQYYLQYEQQLKDYVAQGGKIPQGKSVIDATMLSNIMYYKSAQLSIVHDYAKKIIVHELGLENFGQLPYRKRTTLWHLLQQHFPDGNIEDRNSIFYKFAEFVNARPGEYFNYFGSELPQANEVPHHLLHDIIKIVGLQTKRLCLFPRTTADGWIIKRHLSLNWKRMYGLNLVDEKGMLRSIRPANINEHARILPNELPYAPGHGLSLCGNGVADHVSHGNTYAYEWSDPVDTNCNIDNWPRDIEKMFREFKYFHVARDGKNRLLGESLNNIFHNGMAYSTIHTTQHTHIVTTPIEDFHIYNLPATQKIELPKLATRLEVVPVGNEEDAFFLRFVFEELENEQLIKFLIEFNEALFMRFGGCKSIDVHIHLFANMQSKLVFIYEPHAFLLQLENDTFLNPHNDIVSMRKPQFVQPLGQNISLFTNEKAAGLEYCRDFFDATACPGVKKFVMEFLDQYLHTHQ